MGHLQNLCMGGIAEFIILTYFSTTDPIKIENTNTFKCDFASSQSDAGFRSEALCHDSAISFPSFFLHYINGMFTVRSPSPLVSVDS